jgi:hypothetical protein
MKSSLACGVLAACANAATTMRLPSRTGSVHDFDFLVGAWTIENHTRAADGSWTSFAASSCLRRELGGVVNVDVYQFPTRGYAAMALRTFDIDQRRWSIYWIESRAGLLLPPVYGGFDGSRGEFYGLLLPPVYGGFDGNRGEFYGSDTLAGKPVVFRFLWTRLDTDHARWEQAYTEDGHDWTTNWTMEFTRTDTCR